jgi:hypothetical protein
MLIFTGLGDFYDLFWKIVMTPALQRHDESGAELDALRNLEQAIRACGLPSIMVSGQRQLDSLAAALKQVVDARSMQAAGSLVTEHQ